MFEIKILTIKMETESQRLIKTLQSYPLYASMNDYYIRKEVGKKYNIRRARNSELKTEIVSLSQSNAYMPELPMDVIPLIAQHLPVTKSRALNKAFLKLNPIGKLIYQFIVNHFTQDDFDGNDDIDDHFDDYQQFEAYQQQRIALLSDNDIKFLFYCINKMKHDQLMSMDKQGMEPIIVKSLFFTNDDIMFLNDYDHVYSKTITKSKKKVTLTKTQQFIYTYIKKRFDDIDYERFEDYNDNTMPFKSLDELMKYEQQQVALLTEDDEWFLFQCIDKINKQQLLLGSATDHIIGFSADGFMFLYDRLVIFNER